MKYCFMPWHKSPTSKVSTTIIDVHFPRRTATSYCTNSASMAREIVAFFDDGSFIRKDSDGRTWNIFARIQDVSNIIHYTIYIVQCTIYVGCGALLT